MTELFVGQRVICVATPEQTKGCGYGHEMMPRNGVVYTIRDLRHDVCRLHEIRNQPGVYMCPERMGIVVEEPWFVTTWFRPIDDFKADLSWVDEILREAEQNTPTKIDAKVMEALSHLWSGRE